MATMGIERHLQLAKAERAAGLAFGFQDADEAASVSRARLILLGGMTSAVAGLIAAAAAFSAF